MTKSLRTFIHIVCCSMAMLWIATACISNECLDNKNSLPLAAFYSSEETPKKITLGQMSIYGLNAPSGQLIMEPTTFESSVYLPFRIDEPHTTFIIHYEQEGLTDDAFNDTITFNYDVIPYFVSAACGAIYKYKVNDITHTTHLIDSIDCIAPQSIIDNVATENIAIYFRTQLQEAAKK